MSAIKCPSEYYVWNKKGDYPRHKHNSLEEARTEAQRLARGNIGEEFFIIRVLESVTYSDQPFIYKHFHS